VAGVALILPPGSLPVLVDELGGHDET